VGSRRVTPEECDAASDANDLWPTTKFKLGHYRISQFRDETPKTRYADPKLVESGIRGHISCGIARWHLTGRFEQPKTSPLRRARYTAAIVLSPLFINIIRF
jgi:hypothetical protein